MNHTGIYYEVRPEQKMLLAKSYEVENEKLAFYLFFDDTRKVPSEGKSRVTQMFIGAPEDNFPRVYEHLKDTERRTQGKINAGKLFTQFAEMTGIDDNPEVIALMI